MQAKIGLLDPRYGLPSIWQSRIGGRTLPVNCPVAGKWVQGHILGQELIVDGFFYVLRMDFVGGCCQDPVLGNLRRDTSAGAAALSLDLTGFDRNVPLLYVR